MTRKIIIFFICVLFISGCAYYNRNISLKYTPKTIPSKANKISIKVNEFKDERYANNVLGDITAGVTGIKSAEVRTQDNVSDWITNALKSELKRAGYTVGIENTKNEINGIIKKVHVTSGIDYDVDIAMRVLLKRGNEVLFEKVYYGDCDDITNWGNTTGTYEVAFERALHNAIVKIVTDVNETLRQ